MVIYHNPVVEITFTENATLRYHVLQSYSEQHEPKQQPKQAAPLHLPTRRACGPRVSYSKWLPFFLALCLLASPVTARPDTMYGYSGPITTAAEATIHVGQHIFNLSRTLIGPSMGISSVLWLVMRNDAAVEPKWSWMVFGLWSLIVLLYFTTQCCRVSNHSLYILLTVAVASSCMCMVALVQQSSLQGGLVTAVPPCTSFAAYAVAYFFPDRREYDSWSSMA